MEHPFQAATPARGKAVGMIWADGLNHGCGLFAVDLLLDDDELGQFASAWVAPSVVQIRTQDLLSEDIVSAVVQRRSAVFRPSERFLLIP